MEGFRDGILILAAAAVIIVAGVYASNHVSTGCLDLGFYKTCGVVTH